MLTSHSQRILNIPGKTKNYFLLIFLWNAYTSGAMNLYKAVEEWNKKKKKKKILSDLWRLENYLLLKGQKEKIDHSVPQNPPSCHVHTTVTIWLLSYIYKLCIFFKNPSLVTQKTSRTSQIEEYLLKLKYNGMFFYCLAFLIKAMDARQWLPEDAAITKHAAIETLICSLAPVKQKQTAKKLTIIIKSSKKCNNLFQKIKRS